MCKEYKIQTGFRVSEALNEEIELAAVEFEVSKNSIMTMAVRIGLRHLKVANSIPQVLE